MDDVNGIKFKTMENVRVIRCRSVEIIGLIAPHLTFTDSRLKPIFIEGLVQRMVSAPDSVLLLAAVEIPEQTDPSSDETDTDFVRSVSKLKAFCIAENPGPAFPYIILCQTWSQPGNPIQLSEHMFARMIVWALLLEKSYIRGETRRNIDAIYRRYGFEPLAQVIKLDLSRFRFSKVLSDHPQELLQWATSLNQT